jgi:MFS family permease
MVILVTLPGLVVPPFGGVLIDRVDRRRLGVVLDLARGLVVLSTAAMLHWGVARLWHVYFMVLLLGVGFAVYWSTMNALVQEVILRDAAPGSDGEPPRARLATANTGVLIAVQGGMMSAGAVVGFLYNRYHLSGILAIDGATYLTSALCLLLLIRRGFVRDAPREVPPTIEAPPGPPTEPMTEPVLPDIVEPGLVARFTADLREGLRYLRGQPRVLALGFTYACMMAGVISGHVVLVVLAQDVLRAGATGYGWLEFGWALGAIVGGFSTAWMTRQLAGPVLLVGSLATLAIGHAAFPYVTLLAASVAMNALFGACRAFGGVLTQTAIMSAVPHRLMGRTQSAFAVMSTLMQVIMSFSLGWIAQHVSLYAGFALLGAMYGAAALAAARSRTLGAAPERPVPNGARAG